MITIDELITKVAALDLEWATGPDNYIRVVCEGYCPIVAYGISQGLSYQPHNPKTIPELGEFSGAYTLAPIIGLSTEDSIILICAADASELERREVKECRTKLKKELLS